MLGRLYEEKSSTGGEPQPNLPSLPMVVRRSLQLRPFRRQVLGGTAALSYLMPLPTDNIQGVFPRGTRFAIRGIDFYKKGRLGSDLLIQWRVLYGS
jgi:hypothetical protein